LAHISEYDFDIDGAADMIKALQTVERSGGHIVTFLASGPGGGNPCVVVKFPDMETAKTFIRTYTNNDATETALQIEQLDEVD
jgi:hypothetical protein